jgi:hypothetical protein
MDLLNEKNIRISFDHVFETSQFKPELFISQNKNKDEIEFKFVYEHPQTGEYQRITSYLKYSELNDKNVAMMFYDNYDEFKSFYWNPLIKKIKSKIPHEFSLIRVEYEETESIFIHFVHENGEGDEEIPYNQNMDELSEVAFERILDNINSCSIINQKLKLKFPEPIEIKLKLKRTLNDNNNFILSFKPNNDINYHDLIHDNCLVFKNEIDSHERIFTIFIQLIEINLKMQPILSKLKNLIRDTLISNDYSLIKEKKEIDGSIKRTELDNLKIQKD